MFRVFWSKEMNTVWMAGLIGLGLGGVTIGQAIALPTPAPYNCLTREVWSPEKLAWCNQNSPSLAPEAIATEPNDLPNYLIAVDGPLADSLQGTEWLLEDLNGTGVMDRVQTTLRFDEGDRINGSGGCNRYFSGIQFSETGATATSQPVSIGAVGSTRMACPPAVMNQEDRFFESLQTAQRIEQDGPYLYIYSEGQEQPMRFTQLTTAQPIPGLW